MDNIKVSVIMPIYNAENFLKQSLDCLLQQTLKEIEIICVEDGSTDGTFKILKQYAKEDNRIKIIRQKNQGAGSARNRGLKEAKGEAVIFLDSDDLFHREMLEKAFLRMEEEQSDLVIFGANYFLDSCEKKPAKWMLNWELIENVKTIKTQEHYDIIFNISGSNPWNKLFRKCYIKNYGLEFQNIRKSNDVYFINIAIALSTQISFVDEYLIDYRVSDNSIQGSDRGEGLEFYYALMYLKNKLKEKKLFFKTRESFKKMALQHCVNKIWDAKSYESFYNMHQKYFEMAKDLGIVDCVSRNCEKYLEYRNYILLQKPINSELTYEFIIKYKEWEREEVRLWKDVNRMREIIDRMNVKKRWIVPYENIKKSQKILLYGAGSAGGDIYEELKKNGYQLAGWIDKNYQQYEKISEKIDSVESIKKKIFDLVIIAISDETIANEVEKELVSLYNIAREKIVKI